jgi:two-component system CheB/CheR fusion protein
MSPRAAAPLVVLSRATQGGFLTETPGKAVLEPGAASRWLIAAGVVVLATVVNFAIQGVTHNRVPFLPYFPVLVFVGVYSGIWPALVSLCTSALLAWYFWFPSADRAEPLRAEEGVALLLFFLAGGVVISISVQARALIGHLRTSRAELQRAQAAVRESEEEFARIVNLAPVGLIVARDPSCTKILSNPYAEQLFGVQSGANISLTAPEGPLTGRRFRRGGEPVPLEELPLRIAARTGQSVRDNVLQFDAPGGSALEIIISAEPLLDDVGKPRGAIATLQDLTALRRMESALRSSEERFRVAQDTSLVAFAILEAVRNARGGIEDFVWEYANESAAGIVKQPLASILGRRLRETLPGMEKQGRPFELLARVMETGVPRTTHFDYHADGISGTFETAISKLGDTSVAISFMDVTERQALIDELRATDANLREADRQKDEFLATLAHELRNPMAPIRYAAAIIRPDAPANALEQARDVIERQAAQMSRLLDDLLDMSRITRNVIELKRELVDLRNVVEEAVQTVRPGARAEQQHITLTVPTQPLMVTGDALRLGQVVGNLLQNAIKYTPAGGRIDVVVEMSGEEGLVTVRDTGIGLSAEMLEKAFKLFSQLHSSMSVTKGGLGIGLAISKRLAELHGGTVEASSEGLGRGSAFTVRLPLESQSGLHAVPGDEDDKVVTLFRTEPRVLVVDDNRDAADSLTLLLRSYGLNVHVAYTGRDAVAIAEAVRPDVLLLDLGLPDISGHEVARDVRRHAWARHARIIAVTGWGQEADKVKTREAGFDAHLVKPVDPEELLAYLQQPRPISNGVRAEH